MPDQIKLKTNLRCESCVAKVRPALQAAGISDGLSFDMNSPDKQISFNGNQEQMHKAISVLRDLGYSGEPLISAVPTMTPAEAPTRSFLETYKPLLLVAAFLILGTALAEIKAGAFDAQRAMNDFMGGFFLFFSFFKFLNLSGFADAFSTYDVLGKRSRAYSLIYPFIELLLGISFILGALPQLTNLATAVLMLLGNIGVWIVLRKKQTIQCACLGTVFDLPMTKVTLFENTLMFAMACASLAMRA